MKRASDLSREEVEALKNRKDSYAQANIDQDSLIKALRLDIDRLTADNARLSAELEASRRDQQLLITDGNTRYQAQNDEVARLRALCKVNGIDPNEG
jgi:FtsZ-binding cell division protein ZapB